MSRIYRQRKLLPLLLPPQCSSPATTRLYSSSFRPRPAPPQLPAEQQAEFERLQRAAAVSSAFQPAAATPPSTQSPRHTTDAAGATAAAESGTVQAQAQEQDGEDNVNQGLFRGAPPEFKGDTNPKTGEVGGPKNEPLRWGGEGDWTYNGRATDF